MLTFLGGFAWLQQDKSVSSTPLGPQTFRYPVQTDCRWCCATTVGFGPSRPVRPFCLDDELHRISRRGGWLLWSPVLWSSCLPRSRDIGTAVIDPGRHHLPLKW